MFRKRKTVSDIISENAYGLVLALVVGAFAYGQLNQKVDDLTTKIDRIETAILKGHMT